MKIRTDDDATAEPFGLWGRAFRPFFLCTAIYASCALPVWTLIWFGVLPAPSWLAPMWWHGHEMIFGVVAAAIAGFLLTASPVWTGGPALTGHPLAALVALWVLGRIGFAFAGRVPVEVVAILDLAFLPAVGLALWRTLRGSGQARNHALLVPVLTLAAANGAIHAEALGLASGTAGRALRFAVDVVVLLIVVIGGRITPAFTQNLLRTLSPGVGVRSWPRLNALTIGATAVLAVIGLLRGSSTETGIVALLAGLLAAARLAGWRSWEIRSDPLLWSLHAGSVWVVVGFILVALHDLAGVVPASSALHALTAGAMGATILAVITRVGLGHTGRPLVPPRGVSACYVLVNVAAAIRVLAPFVSGELHRGLLIASTVAWATAFGFVALRYASILVEPRPDGRPG